MQDANAGCGLAEPDLLSLGRKVGEFRRQRLAMSNFVQLCQRRRYRDVVRCVMSLEAAGEAFALV